MHLMFFKTSFRISFWIFWPVFLLSTPIFLCTRSKVVSRFGFFFSLYTSFVVFDSYDVGITMICWKKKKLTRKKPSTALLSLVWSFEHWSHQLRQNNVFYWKKNHHRLDSTFFQYAFDAIALQPSPVFKPYYLIPTMSYQHWLRLNYKMNEIEMNDRSARWRERH